MSALADRHCVALPDGTPALTPDERSSLMQQLDPAWQVLDGKRIRREVKFKDFASALAFVVKVGEMSDAEDHHPDITLSWGRASVELWTHTVNGLSENDFIHAAKTDEIAKGSAGLKAQ